MVWKSLAAAVLAVSVVGCAKEAPQEPKPQPTKTVQPKKENQNATASGQELQVNPNGSLSNPGGKLGGK